MASTDGNEDRDEFYSLADGLRRQIRIATGRSLNLLNSGAAEDVGALSSELEAGVDEAGHLEVAVEEILEAAAARVRQVLGEDSRREQVEAAAAAAEATAE